MLNPRVLDEHAGVSRITDSDLNRFANSLYGYLYYEIEMTHFNQYRNPLFERVIGKAVLRVWNSVRLFNIAFLEKFKYCGSKESLCQRLCDLYPSTDYFKKFFFVSAFILESVSYWNEGEALRDFSLGPTLWRAMFRRNFEREFENKRGWTGLLQAATFFHQVPFSDALLREHLLPAALEGVVSRIRGLHPNPEQADVDEVAALLERIHVGKPKKSGLVGNVEELNEENQPEAMHNRPGPSGLGGNVFQCESIASLEGLQVGQTEENQPGKEAKVEELSEENQSKALDDRPGQSGLGGNAAQTGHLGESSSGKSGEDVFHSLGDGKPRKRKPDVPSKTDSGEKSDYTIPAKAMKEEGDDDKSSREHRQRDSKTQKRQRDSPPKSDSEGESGSVSSAAKERKKFTKTTT